MHWSDAICATCHLSTSVHVTSALDRCGQIAANTSNSATSSPGISWIVKTFTERRTVVYGSPPECCSDRTLPPCFHCRFRTLLSVVTIHHKEFRKDTSSARGVAVPLRSSFHWCVDFYYLLRNDARSLEEYVRSLSSTICALDEGKSLTQSGTLPEGPICFSDYLFPNRLYSSRAEPSVMPSTTTCYYYFPALGTQVKSNSGSLRAILNFAPGSFRDLSKLVEPCSTYLHRQRRAFSLRSSESASAVARYSHSMLI